jgi:excisionase family DNA binding protein
MSRDKITVLEKLPVILSPQQVADYVGIAHQRVCDFCQYGEIKSFTIGALRKIRKSDMVAWLDEVSGREWPT